ncbi:MAG: murein L,D-transpeptidase catalytic domain-containing protein [Ferruginibacter sp.]
MAFKTIAFTCSLTFAFSAFGYLYWYQPVSGNITQKTNTAFLEKKTKDKAEISVRIKQKAGQAKEYISDHGFDAVHCFLLDMRIASGKNRFFVYNLEKDSVEMAGLVSHGGGSENGSDGLIFSNTPNSYCTSLGKYKIGNGYYGNFGLAYKLYGLEPSNSKAYDRFIVLHAYDCVPDKEVYPFPICLSQGCPTVSGSFLTRLTDYIAESRVPIMMWIYD